MDPRTRRRLVRYPLFAAGAMVAILLLAMLGFLLYAAAIQKEERRGAAPDTGSFVQAGDVELFVQQRGPATGDPVVFVHGTGAWSEIWVEAMEAIAAEGHRAIAIDLPPFGFSERPADASYTTPDQGRRIAAVLDALDLRNVTMVGHSFGSRATMEAVFAEEERVARIVLVDAALDLEPDPDPKPSLSQRLLGFRPARDLLVASVVENPLLTRALLSSLLHNDSAATDARVAMLQRPLRLEGTTDAAGAWLLDFLASEGPMPSNDVARYRALDKPVLLLWGAEDTTTPLARAHELAEHLPREELVVLPGVGHIPHVEEPEAFHAALLAFLG